MRHTEPTTLISIRLPKSSAARVARLARRRKTTVSAIIREAVDALDGPSIWHRVQPLISKRGSGKGDLSTNKEHLAGFGE
ncbi:MAG: ribbon-helix-helix protein, CopG family [Archangium sp.]